MWRQILGSSVVRYDEISFGQSFLARRLTGHPGPGIGFGETAMGNESIHRYVRVGIDDDGSLGRIRLALDQQRYVQDHHVVRGPLLLDTSIDLGADPWVDDRVQRFQFLVVVEDDVGDRLPIEGSVGVEDSVTEVINHRGKDAATGRLKFAHYQIGVDHNRTAIAEGG